MTVFSDRAGRIWGRETTTVNNNNSWAARLPRERVSGEAGGKRQGRRKCGGRGRVVLCTRQFYLGLGNFSGEVELIWDWQGLTRPLGFGKELAGV